MFEKYNITSLLIPPRQTVCIYSGGKSQLKSATSASGDKNNWFDSDSDLQLQSVQEGYVTPNGKITLLVAYTPGILHYGQALYPE